MGKAWQTLLHHTVAISTSLASLVLFYVFGFCLFVVLGTEHRALHMGSMQVLYHWATCLGLALICSRFDFFYLPAPTFPWLSFHSVGLLPVLLDFSALAQHHHFHDNSPVLMPTCFPLFLGLLLFLWSMLYYFVWYFQFAVSWQIGYIIPWGFIKQP